MQQKRIQTRQAKVGVIGLGYVGLPLALLAARQGFTVLGFDVDVERVSSLNRGISYLSHIPDRELASLVSGGHLTGYTDTRRLNDCEIVVLCVPTPLDPEGRPDYSSLYTAVETLSGQLQEKALVIVESTVAPGVTVDELAPRLALRGLAAGRDFYLVYSPERLDPGNVQYGLENIPKLVAGLTELCRELACCFYNSLGVRVVPVASPAIAEAAKLLENTYRDVNIALVNEMATIFRRQGLDIWQVINAAATKPFGFLPFYPGPGVGGHCIPVDTVYYSHWAAGIGLPARLPVLAREINATMPAQVARWVAEILSERQCPLSGSKVLILGITYKKNINDMREASLTTII